MLTATGFQPRQNGNTLPEGEKPARNINSAEVTAWMKLPGMKKMPRDG